MVKEYENMIIEACQVLTFSVKGIFKYIFKNIFFFFFFK